MNIGIIGSGVVAETLGAGFLKHGHAVTMGTRDVSKLAKWQAANPKAKVGSFGDAAKSAGRRALDQGAGRVVDQQLVAGSAVGARDDEGPGLGARTAGGGKENGNRY